MAAGSKIASEEISVLQIEEGRADFAVVGTSPLIFNRMAEKARRELLMPRGRKTAADRAQNLKHEPIAEYRASVYRDEIEGGLTRLCFPSPGFKGAMMTAALDLPGATKSAVGRLAWVPGYRVAIYGIPELMMSVVRSADMNRTPDIRTRAIVPQWACVLTVSFVRPRLSATTVGNLLAAAGITCGIGDFRQEKGKGNFGQFRLVGAEDEELAQIIAAGARSAQDAALAEPDCYDAETEELLGWYSAEVVKLTARDKTTERKVA